ncbi:hypothetical protein CFIICLFH_4268 [Methylobacterium goesingense]|uniref:DNA-binding transcriptional LysR family regulator n=1 Tax=Methylobacterium goesingense TaxID=243690 RepID=A0ABV2LAJ5_9HYPH|nr:hypothetical protein CFIICLFH_4268 [Methylobacterium goesingense]
MSLDICPHLSTNENEGAVAAAVAGLGIATTTGRACRRELSEGTLVRLFSDWATADIPVYAYFPMGQATRAAGRAFVEFFAADLTIEGKAASDTGAMG